MKNELISIKRDLEQFSVIPSTDTSYFQARNLLLYAPSSFKRTTALIHSFVMSEASKQYASSHSEHFLLQISMRDISLKLSIDDKAFADIGDAKVKKTHIYTHLKEYCEAINSYKGASIVGRESGNVWSSKTISWAVLVSRPKNEKEKELYRAYRGPYLEVEITNGSLLSLENNYVESDILYLRELKSSLSLKMYEYFVRERFKLERHYVRELPIEMSEACFRFWFMVDQDDDIVKARINSLKEEIGIEPEYFYSEVCRRAVEAKAEYKKQMKESSIDDVKEMAAGKYRKVYPYDRTAALDDQIKAACKEISDYTDITLNYGFEKKTKTFTFVLRLRHIDRVQKTKRKVEFETDYREKMEGAGVRCIASSSADQEHAELLARICVPQEKKPEEKTETEICGINIKGLCDWSYSLEQRKISTVSGNETIDLTDTEQMSRLCRNIMQALPDVTTDEIRRGIYRAHKQKIINGVTAYIVSIIQNDLRMERRNKK